jgi:hypothetical protein
MEWMNLVVNQNDCKFGVFLLLFRTLTCWWCPSMPIAYCQTGTLFSAILMQNKYFGGYEIHVFWIEIHFVNRIKCSISFSSNLPSASLLEKASIATLYVEIYYLTKITNPCKLYSSPYRYMMTVYFAVFDSLTIKQSLKLLRGEVFLVSFYKMSIRV